MLLRCVDKKEPNEIMSEVHDGACDLHMSGHMLVIRHFRWDIIGLLWKMIILGT